MPGYQTRLAEAAFYCTCGSIVASLFSIAVSQSLLGLAFASVLLSGQKLRFPPVKLPLAVFIAGTLLSLALSADPASGRPQIRKFFVLLILLAVASSIRKLSQIRALIFVAIGVGAVSAVRGLVQYLEKMQQAQALGRNFYEFYVGDRISGFMSHWMTFGSQMMMLLLLLAALLFFAPGLGRWRWALAACAVVIGFALALNATRSILFLGTPAGVAYLIWRWNRKWVLAFPILAAVAMVAAPAALRTRFESMFRPRGDLDSNQFRIICWRTGLEMIRAHPLTGVGPEQVKAQFQAFVPADVPRPLPTGWYGHLHNIYLHYAAERGIPTMLALMWFLGKSLWDFLAGLRKAPAGRNDRAFVLQGVVAVLLATLVVGFFELNLGDSEVLLFFLGMIGCGYAALEAAEDAAPELRL